VSVVIADTLQLIITARYEISSSTIGSKYKAAVPKSKCVSSEYNSRVIGMLIRRYTQCISFIILMRRNVFYCQFSIELIEIFMHLEVSF